MRFIQVETTIHATPDKVWQVLTDFPNYSKWNPFILSVSGAFQVGKILRIRQEIPNHPPSNYKARVEAIEENRKLTWRVATLFPGMLIYHRDFLLESLEDGSTWFIQKEEYSGFAVGILGAYTDDIKSGLMAMNQALKKEC